MGLNAKQSITLSVSSFLATPGVGKAANVLVGKVLGTNGTSPSNQTALGGGSVCHPAQTTEAVVLFTIAALGMGANIFLMLLIVLKRPLRRWSQGLLFHQGLVDCGRASLLLLLGVGVLFCQRLPKCNVIETAFLLLVTVSTVNMLTSVINDASLMPDQDFQHPPQQPSPHHHHWHHLNPAHPGDSGNHPPGSSVSLDSPQCIVFGLFIIWFASFTINLGPTLLSGALTSSRDTAGHVDACPMVYGPVGHYVLNVLWVTVNVMCAGLTGVHLRKLYRDLTRSNLEAVRIAGLVTTMISVRSDPQDSSCNESQQIQSYIHRLEQEGLRRVKSFAIILAAYVLFWGPLFTLTLIQPGRPGYALTYEITLHVAFVHSFVNPTLLLMLHGDLRNGGDLCCCCCGPQEPEECGQQQQQQPHRRPSLEMAHSRAGRGYILVAEAISTRPVNELYLKLRDGSLPGRRPSDNNCRHGTTSPCILPPPPSTTRRRLRCRRRHLPRRHRPVRAPARRGSTTTTTTWNRRRRSTAAARIRRTRRAASTARRHPSPPTRYCSGAEDNRRTEDSYTDDSSVAFDDQWKSQTAGLKTRKSHPAASKIEILRARISHINVYLAMFFPPRSCDHSHQTENGREACISYGGSIFRPNGRPTARENVITNIYVHTKLNI